MKRTILAIVMIALPVSHALAVSRAVKIACRDDYFAHCSMHAVGSPGLRQCMRDVGPRLSTQCISALIAAGEVKGTKVASKAAFKSQHTAKKHPDKKQYARKPADKKRFAKALTPKQKLAKARADKKQQAKALAYKGKYAKKLTTKQRLARS